MSVGCKHFAVVVSKAQGDEKQQQRHKDANGHSLKELARLGGDKLRPLTIENKVQPIVKGS